MGYRDDFYVAENLIGYTGELNKMPTAYFRKGDEYGRITQFHNNRLNIGRNTVRTDDTYEVVNEGGRCVEKRKGKVVHTSRNLFIDAAGLSEEDKAVLMQAVWKYPDQKENSDIHGEERQDLRLQSHKMQRVLQDIKKTG